MPKSKHTPASRPLAGVRAGGAVLIACCLLVAQRGCGGGGNPRTQPKDDQPRNGFQTPEEIPGLKEAGVDEESPGAAEVMVKSTYDRQEKETFRYDSRHPAGTIKGSCVFLKPDRRAFPPPQPVRFEGAKAIGSPRPKEVDYYKTIEIKEARWFVPVGGGKHLTFRPVNVVLRLRDVKIGRHPPLDRSVLVVHQGRIIPGDDSNGGANNVQFSPLHERAQFTTWDEFPSHVVLTRAETRQVVFEGTVSYAHGKKGTRNQAGHLAYSPQFIITDPIRAPGIYVVTDKRHPWMKGYLFVVENPYVAVTGTRLYHGRSNWQIQGVPPGRHKLEVWHPEFEPVERVIEVEVKPSQIAEVLVRFHPPRPPKSEPRKRKSDETGAKPPGESKE